MKNENKLHLVSSADLELNIQNKNLNNKGFSIWIRALLQNWRQGTVGSKGRSDVCFSNKKPWKQKGTGRARAGSKRSPLWKGGGVIFGPQPRVARYKVNKGLKSVVLGGIVSNFLKNKKIFSLDCEVDNKPKTAHMYTLLKNLGLNKTKINFLVGKDDVLIQSALANMPNVHILLFDQLNAFDLTTGQVLIFLKKDFNIFKDLVRRWI